MFNPSSPKKKAALMVCYFKVSEDFVANAARESRVIEFGFEFEFELDFQLDFELDFELIRLRVEVRVGIRVVLL